MWGSTNTPVCDRGASRRSDWFRWETNRGLDRSGSGNDFDSRFSEDFALLAEAGLRHLRFTLDWARIEPFAGRHDHEALELTHVQLQAAKDAGLHVWLTLHDGSLPGWFSEDTDGFRSTAGPSIHWSRHVDRMAELYDGYAEFWMPTIDPIGWAIRSHLLGQRPPGRRSIGDTQDAIEGAVDATFDAHRLLASGSTPVVGNFALPSIHATGAMAEPAAKRWDNTIWRSWSRAITEGVLEWPWRAAAERPDMADAFDAIGIGIAAPMIVDADGLLGPYPEHADRRDSLGLTPGSVPLDEALHRVSELVTNKDFVVTGFGLDHDDDAWRSSLFEQWLDAILAARNEGVAIRGVFVEPAVDGYSEAAGAFVDAGVFTQSRETKTSFRWIAAQQ